MPGNDWRADDRERERWERQGTPPRGRDWRGDLDYSDYGDPAAIYQERSFQPYGGRSRHEAGGRYENDGREQDQGRYQNYGRERDQGRYESYGREQDRGRYQNYGRERDPGRHEDYGRARFSGPDRDRVFGERETGMSYRTGGPFEGRNEGYDPSAGPNYGRQGFASGRYSQGGYDEPDYEGRGRGRGGFGPSNFRQGEESYGYGGYGIGASNTYAGGEREPSRGYGGREQEDHGRGGDHERGEHWWDRAAQRIERWMGNVDRERGWEGHRGRGPKGYSRSDDRIRDDAHDRLTEDPYVDASEIEVMVSGGEVTLNGTVDSREAKHHAEHCIERISGVRHVQNNLRVQSHGGRDYDRAWSQGRGGGAVEHNPVLTAQARGDDGHEGEGAIGGDGHARQSGGSGRGSRGADTGPVGNFAASTGSASSTTGAQGTAMSSQGKSTVQQTESSQAEHPAQARPSGAADIKPN